MTVLLFVGGSQTTISGQTKKVTSIQAPSFVEMNVGDASSIKVVVSPENASNKSCQWICDSPDMLKIDKENGTVTGLKVGNVNIKIAAEDGSGVWTMCRIKINGNPTKIAEAKENIVYDVKPDVLDKNPSFPGGESKFKEYILKNFTYPRTKSLIGIDVVCSFIVEKDGSITDVQIKKSSKGPSYKELVTHFIESLPKWEPAMKDGKLVRARCLRCKIHTVHDDDYKECNVTY